MDSLLQLNQLIVISNYLESCLSDLRITGDKYKSIKNTHDKVTAAIIKELQSNDFDKMLDDLLDEDS